LDRLANSLDQERRAYNHFIDYYTETKEGWLAMLSDLLEKITDLQAELNVLNKKID
jgi:lipid II:glycine glycyltransferase (peptidoglycan interpeptide bridge formation enzyme)